MRRRPVRGSTRITSGPAAYRRICPPVSLTGSAYGVFNLHSQTGVTAATTTDDDDITDHGVGLVLWGQATPSLDLSLWVSHSLAYISYTTVTLSATYTFSVHPTPKPSRTRRLP